MQSTGLGLCHLYNRDRSDPQPNPTHTVSARAIRASSSSSYCVSGHHVGMEDDVNDPSVSSSGAFWWCNLS